MSTVEKELTISQQNEQAIVAELAKLGNNQVSEDALVFEGRKFVLPESMAGDIPGAIQWLKAHQEAQEEETRFNRVFKYRPLDGANALQNVLRKIWGSSGVAQATYSFFGKIPPVLATIDIGVDETTQVPQGQVNFPPLKAEMHVTSAFDPELGPLFRLVIDAPRKYRDHIEGLFKAVEMELRENSIYRGKAITGAETPGFVDVWKVKRTEVIYSDDVMAQLEANVWSVIKHTDLMRELGLPIKRSVLLGGPYGTGKTLAGTLTAQVANDHGFTYVLCRPGQDDLAATMRTAVLYAPAVVFFEDVDTVAENGDPEAVTKLLDLFDGVTAKHSDIIAVMTTNHVDRIHRGMLRPGRLDAVLHIGELDASGIERLIRAKIRPDLLGEMDIDPIYKAMEGFVPAFAAEAIDRAVRYSIARTNGRPDVLTTEDFVRAAEGLRPQLDLMNDAGEGKRQPSADAAFASIVQGALHDARLLDSDGDARFRLATQGEKAEAVLY